MLHNDREGLHQLINTVGKEPGIVSIRIIDQNGIINYSTESHEIARQMNPTAEACPGCHSEEQTRSELTRMQRFRIHRDDGTRVLSIITLLKTRPLAAMQRAMRIRQAKRCWESGFQRLAGSRRRESA